MLHSLPNTASGKSGIYMKADVRLAVLASGGGTTLQNLLDRIADRRLDAQVVRVISNNADAIVLERAAAPA